jgi:aryl-alcohol dehydrogenase-like predicted oxidoreductase
MSFGDNSIGMTGKGWALGEADTREVIKRALDSGINFFDTANVYSGGTSEVYVGKALRDFACRDEVVIATKVCFPMREGQNSFGLSRKAIMAEVDHSLERLGTDYIDLYIIHRFDPYTPVEETMEALHDVIKSGKVRYIGASTMHSWQLSKMQYTAEKHGWTKFVSMQNMYNLLYREEEREMIGLCQDMKMAVTPWSPLAKGRLARPFGTRTTRYDNDPAGQRFFPENNQSDMEIIKRVGELAEKRGVEMSQIALAWLFSKPYITAPIVGPTKPQYIDSMVKAMDIELTDEETNYLEEAYVPHNVIG